MAAAPYSIADIIQIAQISTALSLQDIQRKNVYGTQIIEKDLPILLNMEWKTLQWCNDSGYDPSTLDARGAYVYALCIKYLQQALTYMGQQGGSIVNPSTGLAATIQSVFYQGTVDGAGNITLTTGQTEIIVPDDYIMADSLVMIVDNSELPVGNYTDRYSYTVSYSTTEAAITFYNGNPNVGLQSGQIVQIRGFKFVSS